MLKPQVACCLEVTYMTQCGLMLLKKPCQLGMNVIDSIDDFNLTSVQACVFNNDL